jgi:hypothetical protein
MAGKSLAGRITVSGKNSVKNLGPISFLGCGEDKSLKILGLFLLHVICLYFLRLLWRAKNETIKQGGALTKMGYMSKKKSPRLFYFSVWIDFVVLTILYIGLIAYSIFLLAR